MIQRFKLIDASGEYNKPEQWVLVQKIIISFLQLVRRG